MKTRTSFVSNSSSSSFIIKNITKKRKTLEDFILENKHLVKLFNERYDGCDTLGDLLNAAEKNYDYVFPPDVEVCCVFGDEQDNALGRVYDYILRDFKKSKSFTCKLIECRGLKAKNDD